MDSSVVQQWILDHPEYRDSIFTLCSWGPLPIQPIVVNKNMPGTNTSLKIDKTHLKEW